MTTTTAIPPLCMPEDHRWTPVGETLIVRDPQTHRAVGCLLPVVCENCAAEADATWDLPQL